MLVNVGRGVVIAMGLFVLLAVFENASGADLDIGILLPIGALLGVVGTALRRVWGPLLVGVGTGAGFLWTIVGGEPVPVWYQVLWGGATAVCVLTAIGIFRSQAESSLPSS